jgi:serine/threonine-protein kinase HipA
MPTITWGITAAFWCPDEGGDSPRPAPGSFGLSLNISETDNSLDLQLVRSIAPFFRVTAKAAHEIIKSSQAIVKQWRKIAGRLDLSARACDQMAPAFRLAG